MIGGPVFTALSPEAAIPSLATHIPSTLVALDNISFWHTVRVVGLSLSERRIDVGKPPKDRSWP